MKKIKIVAFLALTLVCLTSAVFAPSSKVYASSTGLLTYSQQQKTITQVNNIGTYNLFDGISSDNYGNYASAYVKYALPTAKPSFTFSDGGLKIVSGSASEASNVNGNFFIYSDLSSALSTAIKNGAVSISASIKLKTDSNGEKDAAEKLYAVLQIGSHGNVSDGGVDFSFSCTDDIGVDENFSAVASANASDSVNGKQWTDFTEYKMSLSAQSLQGLSCQAISIHTYTDFVKPSSFWCAATSSNTMYLTSPTLTLTTTDVVAPKISKIIVDDSTDSKKTVTIYVSDAESGVQSLVLQNGTNVLSTASEPVFDETTRNAVYKFNVSCGTDYTIVAMDNVGNTSSQALNVNNIEVKSLYVQKDIAIASSLNDGLTYYYTIDGSEPTVASHVLSNGTNNISVSENKGYTLRVKGFYADGSYVYYEKSFRVDDTDYLVNVFGSDIEQVEQQKVKYGTQVTINLVANEGYCLYKVLINNNQQVLQEQYSFDVTEDVNIQVYCRKVVENLIPATTYFVYNGQSVQLDFGINVDEFVFSCNGSSELPKDVGTHTVEWKVDSDTQVGNGSFDITIQKYEVVVESVVGEYVYKQFEFSYTLANVDDEKYLAHKIKKSGADVLSSQPFPGEYTYEIYSIDNNVAVVGSTQGNLVITKIKVSFGFKLDEVVQQFDGLVHSVKAYLQEEIDELNEKFGVAISLDGKEVENVYNVGTYTCNIQLDDDMAQYYETDSQKSFVIAPRQIKITPLKNQYRYVDQTDTVLQYSVDDLPEGILLTGSLSREQGDNAGDYAIELGSLTVDCENASNYQVVLDNNEQVFYTILSRQLMVKVDSFTAEYGQNDPIFTAKVLYGTLKDGEKLVVSREQGNNVGTYSIKNVVVVDSEGKDVSANYSLVVIGGTYTITPRLVSVKSIGFTKTYGTQDTQIEYVADGLLDSDVLSGSLSREVGEDVGTYMVTIGTLLNKNYTITLDVGFCTIVAQNVTVSVEDIEKSFGQADPQLTAQCGQANLDDLKLTFSREQGEDIGEYAIVLDSFNGNYNVLFDGAKLTVKPKIVYVTLNSLTKIYGQKDPAFSYSLDGDYEDIQITVCREEGENVGTYSIYAKSNENYTLVCNEASLVIEKADFDFTVEEHTVVYNGSEQFLAVEQDFVVTYRDASGTVVDAPKNAGTYTAEVTYNGDENHNTKTVETIFVIAKKRISVIVDASAVKYAGKEQMPIFSTPGFDSSAATIEFDGQQIPVEIGSYGYTINFADDNYYFNVHATLTIVE